SRERSSCQVMSIRLGLRSTVSAWASSVLALPSQLKNELRPTLKIVGVFRALEWAFVVIGGVPPSLPPPSRGWDVAQDRPSSRDSRSSWNSRSPSVTRFESKGRLAGTGTMGSVGGVGAEGVGLASPIGAVFAVIATAATAMADTTASAAPDTTR